jgi:hypothetical protein
MQRTRVAEAATRTTPVPVVAAVVAAVIAGIVTAGWAGVAVLTGLDADQPTTTLLVEGGNRGW